MGIESRITSKGQTTIPAQVRKWLAVSEGDHLIYVPTEDGGVKILAKNLTTDDAINVLGPPPNGRSYPGDSLVEAIDQAVAETVKRRRTVGDQE